MVVILTPEEQEMELDKKERDIIKQIKERVR